MSEYDWTQVPTPGLDKIRQERLRQLAMESYGPGHDDAHTNGEIRDAALSYLEAVRMAHLAGDADLLGVPFQWPWENESFKFDPEDPIRTLTKAGALIAAEIDRLERAAALGDTNQTEESGE